MARTALALVAAALFLAYGAATIVVALIEGIRGGMPV